MLLIFDVDGTLTESGKQISDKMLELLESLKNRDYELIIVGGGNYEKILWQLKNRYDLFNCIFVTCGAELYRDNTLIYKKNFLNFCNRKILNEMIRICLKDIAELDILYSGGQIDFRSGLVYVSPVGMQATDVERDMFIRLDKEKDIRKNMIGKLKDYDYSHQFDIVLGGSVGFSIYPVGWNKSQI